MRACSCISVFRWLPIQRLALDGLQIFLYYFRNLRKYTVFLPRGCTMSDIRLEDRTIQIDGKWLTEDELIQQIQEKIQSGDMKFTKIAAALEDLNTALEESKPLEVKLVISKEHYEKLKAFGGEDDCESVRMAIAAFIASSGQPSAMTPEKKMLVVKCPQCKHPIEVTTDDRPVLLECQYCGTSGRLTAKNRWAKLDQI